MKIGILSRKPNSYSTKRLKSAAIKRGHSVEIIDTLRCYMNISAKNPEVHYKGKKLEDFDAIIPRISAKITFYGTAVVRQFEMMGVFSLNESVAIARSRDKLRSLQLLSRHGLGMPVTGFASSPAEIDKLITIASGPPLVIKLIEGTQGVGVVRADTINAAESVIDAFMGLKANILVQEFIQEASGADIRCFVLNNKVIAAMGRQAPPGEFRANLHRGGVAQNIEITTTEQKLAVRAAKIMGLSVAGVDIIRSRRGPLVLEVNSSPGLHGIESITKKDIASSIIKFIEKNAKPFTNKTRGQG